MEDKEYEAWCAEIDLTDDLGVLFDIRKRFHSVCGEEELSEWASHEGKLVTRAAKRHNEIKDRWVRDNIHTGVNTKVERDPNDPTVYNVTSTVQLPYPVNYIHIPLRKL